MQIIDGYCNEPNIFADDIGEYNTAIWGTRDCVLPAGERLGYELVSNNEIKIKDGVFSTQGRRGVIKKGTTESCIIENGTQAENRNDLIVIEYAKDSSTLVESHTLKVIKGTPGETATDPDVVTGDIQAGDVLHQMPLYRVKLEGLNVVAVERLFSVGNNAIGKEFDPDKDYEIGNLTLQYNKAWKFKAKHLAGAWDESQMEETDVLTELAEQNKNFAELNKNLTFPDGTGFYPDEQDGQKGYNTSPNRGADTFFPFNADLNIIAGFGHNKELVIPKNIKKALAIFDGHGQTSDVSTWTITITSSNDQSKEVVHFNKVPDTYRVLYTYPFNFYSAVITNLHKDDTIKASASISYLIIY